MTSKDSWLYENEEYKKALKRFEREANTLNDLLVEMNFAPATDEDREEIAKQSAKQKAAHIALKELREQLLK
jgi:hypothetical protein